MKDLYAVFPFQGTPPGLHGAQTKLLITLSLNADIATLLPGKTASCCAAVRCRKLRAAATVALSDV
jgi:hypothetical protein